MANILTDAFRWEDPLLLDGQLDHEERQIAEAARDYCQGRLLPRPAQMARLFSVTMVTSAAMLKSNPDALARFARAAAANALTTLRSAWPRSRRRLRSPAR